MGCGGYSPEIDIPRMTCLKDISYVCPGNVSVHALCT